MFEWATWGRGWGSGKAVNVSAPAAPAWDIDATSGVAKPSTAAQYTAWRTAGGVTIANPASLFNCTEVAANASLVDAIGARTFVRNGTTVSAAVPGWTAAGVKSTDVNNAWWELPGEDLAAVDVAAFLIFDPNTIDQGAIFSLNGTSQSNADEIVLLSDGKIRARRGPAVLDSTNTYSGPLAAFLVCNQSASNFSVYLKPIGSGVIETLTPTWSGVAGGTSTVYLASGWDVKGVDATFLEVDYWTGANATITAGQVATFFSARGV